MDEVIKRCRIRAVEDTNRFNIWPKELDVTSALPVASIGRLPVATLIGTAVDTIVISRIPNLGQSKLMQIARAGYLPGLFAGFGKVGRG